MFCGETSTITDHGDYHAAHRLRCRRWACEQCRPYRCAQLRALAKAGHPTKFITLTVDPQWYDDPHDAARALVHAWRMVVQAAKREGVATHIPYLAVFEETKQGWPHLHVLARCPYIDHDWLRAKAIQHLRSPQVWIRAVASQKKAASYVAKYVSKSPERFIGTKRYWRTRDYQTDPTPWDTGMPVHDHEPLFSPSSVERLAWAFERSDYAVTWDSTDSWVAYPSTWDAIAPMWQTWIANDRGPPRER